VNLYVCDIGEDYVCAMYCWGSRKLTCYVFWREFGAQN
jgi:hypothetical protein